MVDPLTYFSFQFVLHNWCNKGVVCTVLQTKDCLLLIEKSSSLSVGSGFPLSLIELSFTIY